MAIEVMPLTREAGVELLIQQAPLPPAQHSHTYDDDIGVEWLKADQIIHLLLNPGETRGRWLSWNQNESEPNPQFQYLDITEPDTWQSLLTELRC